MKSRSCRAALAGVLAALTLLLCHNAAAQHEYQPEAWQRPKYFQLTYETEKLHLPGFEILGYNVPTVTAKSTLGFNIATGKTYYLPSPKPELLRFGIDATWFKLRFLQYKYGLEDYDNQADLADEVRILYRSWVGDANVKNYRLDVAMQAGLSFNLNPARKVMMSFYGRYQPTLTLVADPQMRLDGFYGFSQGANYGFWIGFSAVAFGVERMKATSRNLRPIFGDKVHEDIPGYLYEGDANADETREAQANGDMKVSSEGINFYLAFRIFGLSRKDKRNLNATGNGRHKGAAVTSNQGLMQF